MPEENSPPEELDPREFAAAAIQEIANAVTNGMVLKDWVMIFDGIDADGDPVLITMNNRGATYWTLRGFLDVFTDTLRATATRTR